MCVALFLFMWVVLSCVITKLSIGAVKKKQQSTSIIMLGVILQIWITKKLGDNIRNYREQRGFTQEKISRII